MADDLNRKLTAFVISEIAAPGPRAAIQIQLFSSAPGMRGEEIYGMTREADHRQWCSELGPILASEILQRATNDADGLGPGAHRYKLVTTNHLGGNARLAFRIRGDEMPEDETTGEEMATPQGLMAQLMRHNEATTRMMVQGFSGMIQQMNRRLEATDSRMAVLEAERAASFAALEAARSGQSERELAELKAVNNEKRKDQAFDKITALMPAVVNRIAGKNMLPEGKSPRDMMIEQFRDSLTPEQRQMIASGLRPDQLITLLELMRVPDPPKAADSSSAPATNGTEKVS